MPGPAPWAGSGSMGVPRTVMPPGCTIRFPSTMSSICRCKAAGSRVVSAFQARKSGWREPLVLVRLPNVRFGLMAKRHRITRSKVLVFTYTAICVLYLAGLRRSSGATVPSPGLDPREGFRWPRPPPPCRSGMSSCASGDYASTLRSAARASRSCSTRVSGARWACGTGCTRTCPGSRPSPSTRRASAARRRPGPRRPCGPWPGSAARCWTSSPWNPRTCSARRSAVRSRSRWRSRIPGGCAASCWPRRPSAASRCPATWKRSGTSSTRAPTIRSGWNE